MDGEQITVSITQAIPRLPEAQPCDSLDWIIRKGEQWAIVGANGSGKSQIAGILQGKYPLKHGTVRFHSKRKINEIVRCIAFRDIYSLADCRNAYYQQRWHATETDTMPNVRDLLPDTPNDTFTEMIYTLFHIRESLSKRIIHLSSGELRKFLIIRTLLLRPEILILDNPFIGLDAASRKILLQMLEQMVSLQGLQVVLLLSDPTNIPSMITHVLPVSCLRPSFPRTRIAFLADKQLQSELFPDVIPPLLPQRKEAIPYKIAFRMEHVTVSYNGNTILKDICWEAKNGERWALCGANGSGKSLLLSLLYADNPQAYAQSLSLFDRKRGTGESIWDIKRRIGYVSPEMHLYYMENVTVTEVVCSGFFDAVGQFRRCNPAQKETAIAWMRVFGIETLKDRMFPSLSTGEQRLTLLARAFVKDPDLLILDEPLHGLDVANKRRVTHIIESFCEADGKTLIYVTHYPDELPSCVNRRYELCN